MAVKTNVNQMVNIEGKEWRPEKTAAGDGNYERYVGTIRDWVAKWPEIAYALKVIKNNLLWQSAGKYDNWPDFLRTEFDMSPRHANRLIEADDTRNLLQGSTSGTHGSPSKGDKTVDIPERNLRELHRLPDAAVSEAYDTITLKAVAAGHKATHSDFKRYVDVLEKKPKDEPERDLWDKLARGVTMATAATAELKLTDDNNTLVAFSVKMRKARKVHGW